MKVHSNIVGYTDVFRNILKAEKEAGRIAPHVHFKTLEVRGSRSHKFAMEVQLEAMERDNGRRAGNSGSYGAMQPEYDGYAATYDEWGWLIAAFYKVDPRAVWGTVKYPVYRDAEEFHEKTAYSYSGKELLPLLENGGDPFPVVVGNAARTKKGFFVGRYGANRVRTQPSYWPGKVAPRSPEEYRAFAKI